MDEELDIYYRSLINRSIRLKNNLRNLPLNSHNRYIYHMEYMKIQKEIQRIRKEREERKVYFEEDNKRISR